MEKVIDGFAHVGIMVQDLEASIEFYCPILEFELIHKTAFKRGKIAFVKNSNLILELVQPGTFQCSGDGFVDHIALSVHNIEAVKVKLEARGIRYIDDDITFAPPFFSAGMKWIMFRGPSGEKIELNEIL